MSFRKLSAAITAFMLSGACLPAIADTLHVELDTSTLGASGWIDLSFLGASNIAAAASATLSDFVGFDAAGGVQPWGNVSGSLTGGYMLGSGGLGADLFHAVSFGGKISFNVDFSGDTDPGRNPALSTLSVALYAPDKTTPLGRGDAASAALMQLYWTPAKTSAAPGTVSYQIFDPIASVSAVPEPSGWAMLAGGLGLLGLARRRKACAPLSA